MTPIQTRLGGRAWLLLSLVAHVALVASLQGRDRTVSPLDGATPSTMVDVEVPEAPAPPIPEPPEQAVTEVPTPEQAPSRPTRRRRPRAPDRVRPPEPPGGGRPDAVTTEGRSSWSQPTGQGGRGGGTGRGVGEGAGNGVGTGGHAPKRPPPSLSIWLDPPRLVRRSLITPMTGLLMAVPGYRDVLRSTGIRPFSHLSRLRIRLGGLQPRRLSVAGVHDRGRDAVKTAATRTAATRGLVPAWRSADGVLATTWADGSHVDRGVAIADGAFVVAARREMPKVLGRRDPRATVTRLSDPGPQVVLKLLWQQPARYLPGLADCGLASLRLSFAGTGSGGNRASLSARYDTAELAERAAGCLRERNRDTPLQPLMTRLLHARPTAGQRTARTTFAADNDALSAIVEGVAWATRRAKARR